MNGQTPTVSVAHEFSRILSEKLAERGVEMPARRLEETILSLHVGSSMRLTSPTSGREMMPGKDFFDAIDETAGPYGASAISERLNGSRMTLLEETAEEAGIYPTRSCYSI